MKLAKISIFVGVIACGLIATRAPLHAQVVDAPNIAGSDNMPWNRGISVETRIAARELFLEGNRLFKIPLFSQAVEKYNQAIAQWKHPAFYFNLALAEINLGQYLEAREDLEVALKSGAEPLRADRFAEAQKQLVEVKRHLGRIQVTCPTQGAEVTLDGAVLFVGPGDREVWVKAQAHEVSGKRSAYGTRSKRVTVAAGARETVDLSLNKLIEDRPFATWKPWAVLGAGVAIVATGGVLQAISARNFNTYDTRFATLPCAATGCTKDQIGSSLNTKLDHAKLEKNLAFGGYALGGLVAAGGVVLLYMNRTHLTEQEDATQNSTGIAIAPVVSRDMLGMAVTVSH